MPGTGIFLRWTARPNAKGYTLLYRSALWGRGTLSGHRLPNGPAKRSVLRHHFSVKASLCSLIARQMKNNQDPYIRMLE